MAISVINSNEFLKGESSADWAPDGGFSPSSYGLNLIKTRGLLYFSEGPTARGGATLTGNPIAFCVDPALTGNDAYFIDDEGAYYTYNGTTLTKRQTGVYEYQLGSSDLIPFGGNFYATSKTTVAQFNNDIGTLTEDWWSGLNGSYRHPLEVIEDELFIANLNVVYFYNGSSSGTAVTLPTGMNVTSLRKHTDGRTLLAFCGTTADFSHTRNGSGRVYYIDPNLRDWTREVVLPEQVEGTRVVGGVIFCTYGDQLGYFDGNGLNFLKKLGTSATTYSQSLSNMEEILIVRDGINCLAFGDLGRGKVWWNLSRPLFSGSLINCPFYKGNSVMLFGNVNGTAGELTEVDFKNTGVDGVFYSNRMPMATENIVRRVELLHTPSNSSGATIYDVGSRDELTDTTTTFHTFSETNETISYRRIEANIRTQVFQLVIDPSTYSLGYKMMRIYHEPIER